MNEQKNSFSTDRIDEGHNNRKQMKAQNSNFIRQNCTSCKSANLGQNPVESPEVVSAGIPGSRTKFVLIEIPCAEDSFSGRQRRLAKLQCRSTIASESSSNTYACELAINWTMSSSIGGNNIFGYTGRRGSRKGCLQSNFLSKSDKK